MSNTPVEKLLRHFGLTCLPFTRSVPEGGLLEHRSFVEARERLRLAVESKAAMLLTAEHGLGKSTLLGAFSDDLDPLAKEGTSRFEVNDQAITLHGKLSVVTYFVAVAVARGFDYAQARIWAMNLYRRMFPLSASRHVERDGFIVRNAAL